MTTVESPVHASPAAPTAPEKTGWWVALGGAVVVLVGAIAVLALHVLPATSGVDWYRRTISEYAYTGLGWVFNTAVVLVSAGSALVGVGLWLSHRGRRITVASVSLLLWSAALIVLVVFPKHDWSVGPSAHGAIHRAASLVAFASLPIAAVAIGLTHRRRIAGWLTLAFGAVSAALLVCLLGAAVLSPGGLPWWQVFPLGLMERGIAGFAVAAVITAAWVARVPARARTTATPAARQPGQRRQNSLPSGSAITT